MGQRDGEGNFLLFRTDIIYVDKQHLPSALRLFSKTVIEELLRRGRYLPTEFRCAIW
jgi:hypothetical protein